MQERHGDKVLPEEFAQKCEGSGCEPEEEQPNAGKRGREISPSKEDQEEHDGLQHQSRVKLGERERDTSVDQRKMYQMYKVKL